MTPIVKLVFEEIVEEVIQNLEAPRNHNQRQDDHRRSLSVCSSDCSNDEPEHKQVNEDDVAAGENPAWPSKVSFTHDLHSGGEDDHDHEDEGDVREKFRTER